MSRPTSPNANITYRRGQAPTTSGQASSASPSSQTTASSMTLISPPIGCVTTTTTQAPPVPSFAVSNQTPTSFRTYQARTQARLEQINNSHLEYFSATNQDTIRNFAPNTNSSAQIANPALNADQPITFGRSLYGHLLSNINDNEHQDPIPENHISEPISQQPHEYQPIQAPSNNYTNFNPAAPTNYSQWFNQSQANPAQPISYQQEEAPQLLRREDTPYPQQEMEVDQHPSRAHTPPPQFSQVHHYEERQYRCHLPTCNGLGQTKINCTRCYSDFHCICIGIPEGSQNNRNMQFKCNLCLEFSGIENQLATLQQSIVRANTQTPPTIHQPLPINLPDFHGRQDEDPIEFIHNCEANLEAAACHPDRWIFAVVPKLRDRAKDWWISQKNVCRTWHNFQQALIAYFDSPVQKVTNQARFYGETQLENEPCESFVGKKLQMWRRLHPHGLDNDAVAPILQLMKPSIRPYLIINPPQSIQQLLLLSNNIEQASTQTAKQEPPTQSETRRNHRNFEDGRRPHRDQKHFQPPPLQPFQAPKCRMCPGYHLHRDCPQRTNFAPPRGNMYRPPNENNFQPPRGNNYQRPFEYNRQTTSAPQRPQAEYALRQPTKPGPSSHNPFQSKSLNTPLEVNTIDESPNSPKFDFPLPLIRLPSYLNNTKVNTLIDSGAAINIVSTHLLNNEYIEPVEYYSTLAEKGTTLKISGKTTINLQIEKDLYDITCYSSPDLSEDLILGQPFLSKFNAIIDYTRDSITIGGDRRQLIYWHEPPPSNKEIKIPPSIIDHIPDPARTNLLKTLEQHKSVFNDEGELESLDVIERSTSPYNSPVLLTEYPPESKKEPRLCIDFRRLNEITVDEPCLKTNIHTLIHEMQDASIFSTLDLKKGYYQVEMNTASRPYTAFTTPDGGVYQFKKMPFGLKTAPACFQRLMTQQVLDGLIGLICLIYLDDILIFSRTWEEHVTHIALVLERLQNSGLTASIKKCQFGKASLEYLGHIIAEDGNYPMNKHLAAVKEREPPKNKKQLQSFLGICNWLRDFTENAATVLAPLTEHLKNTKWNWTEEDDANFNIAKEVFSNIKKLHRPDFSGPTFYLQTDASEIGLGAVLFQYGPDGSKRIISFASAKLSPQEAKYSSNERECLAIVWGVKKYRIYLEDRPFVIRTDNQSLTWLHKFMDSKAKLTRWAILLSELTFTIEHIAGKENELADALSRSPQEHKDINTEDWERMELPRVPKEQKTEMPVLTISSLLEDIKTGQELDPDCKAIKEQLDTDLPNPLHSVKNGTLFQRKSETTPWKVLVPVALILAVIHYFHDNPLASHPGEAVTFDLISKHHYWNSMKTDIKNYVRTCEVCARNKTAGRTTKTGLTPRAPTEVWETLALDLMGPYPRSKNGKQFLIVVTDLYSRWVEAKAVSSSNTKQIILFLEQEIFSRFGYPKKILSDNGPQFTSDQWRKACESWCVTPMTTAPYHPRQNPCEARNNTLKTKLRIHLDGEADQRHWDAKLPEILFALRNSRNEATQYSPSELIFGSPLKRPGEWSYPLTPNPPLAIHLTELRTKASENIRSYQKRYNKVLHNPVLPPGTWYGNNNNNNSSNDNNNNSGNITTTDPTPPAANPEPAPHQPPPVAPPLPAPYLFSPCWYREEEDYDFLGIFPPTPPREPDTPIHPMVEMARRKCSLPHHPEDPCIHLPPPGPTYNCGNLLATTREDYPIYRSRDKPLPAPYPPPRHSSLGDFLCAVRVQRRPYIAPPPRCGGRPLRARTQHPPQDNNPRAR
ncbi:hypothetical protein WDU94_013913 [Cyamophila willieti]